MINNKLIGSISFEKNKIKLIVLKEKKIVFYDEIIEQYDEKFNNVYDLEKIYNVVSILTKKADDFLSNNLTNYIFNIPFIQLNKEEKTSIDFNIIGKKIDENYINNLYNKIPLLSNNDKKIIYSEINEYLLDNNEISPSNILGKSGDKIKFNYTNYCVELEKYNVLLDIAQKNSIKIIQLINNQIIQNELYKNDIYTYIGDNDVYFYNDGGVFISKNFISNIFEITKNKLVSNFDILKALEFNNSISVLKTETEIGIIFNNEYLSYTTIMNLNITKYFNYTLNNELIKSVENTINSNYNNIIINGGDTFYKIINNIKFCGKNEISDVFSKYNSSILDDCNVASLFESIDSYISYYSRKYDKIVYSVSDIDISRISSKVFKNNNILKLGIVSTKFATKV